MSRAELAMQQLDAAIKANGQKIEELLAAIKAFRERVGSMGERREPQP